MSYAPQHPAGWYPDPQNSALVRWWDGYRWAEAWQHASSAVVRRDIPTHTVWIWLVVLLPLTSLAALFLIDWRGFLEGAIRSSMQSPSVAESWMLSWSGGTLALTALGYAIAAAQILFAYLDWRALRLRGVQRPFHWAWILLTLLVSNGVYVIGRGVVLRSRTGSGLGPVWVWIAVNALGLVIGLVFAVVMITSVFAIFAQEGMLYP